MKFSEMKRQEWSIRKALGSDLPFIYATWLENYRHTSVLGKGCRNSVFFKEYTRVIDWILNQDSTTTLVACQLNDPDIIYGYLVSQPDTLHYLFIKQAFRGFGIGTHLYQEANQPKTFTHKTEAFFPFFSKHELTYNPFLLFKQEDPIHGETR